MHGHRYRASGDGRKATVVLFVLAAHAFLLTLRLPTQPSGAAPDRSPPLVVLLIAPAAPPPVLPRARPEAAHAGAERHRAPAPAPEAARDERALPASAEKPEPASRPDPRPLGPRIALPSDDPKAGRLQVPPSLAERARERAGEPGAGSALQRGVARSVRPDCKDAYSGLVLLAIPALLVDSVRQDGCKW